MYWEKLLKHGESKKLITPTENFKGLGLEIELDSLNGKNKAVFREEVAKILLTHSHSDHYYVERDSSLYTGMELITVPHTIDELRTFISTGLGDILTKVKAQGVESGVNGLHIHVSRLVFGSVVEEQADAIAKLRYFYSVFAKKLVKIGGRQNYRLCRFEPELTQEEARVKTLKDLTETDKRKVFRYKALNLQNDATVEFRAMASTTDVNVLSALVELVWHLSNRAKVISWSDVDNWSSWLAGAPFIVKGYVGG